jgi:hypothetical protein
MRLRPDREDPRSRLATPAHLGDIEAIPGQPLSRAVRVRNSIGDSPQLVRCAGVDLLGQRRRDLDADPADAEEEEPRAPFLEGLVEGQPDPSCWP